MKKKVTSVLYAAFMLGVIIILWMDIAEFRKINALNFSLLIVLSVIVSVIFSEIVFDKPKKIKP